MLNMHTILKMRLLGKGMMFHLLFIIFLAGISFPALAHEPEGRAKKINFSEIKKARLEKLDNIRACIAKSNNFKELRACKPMRKS